MINSLIGILSEYSFSSFLIIVSAISLYLIYYTPLKETIKRRTSTTTRTGSGGEYVSDKDRLIELLSHEFFRNIDLKIGVELPISKYSDAVNRNILIRDMTLILFSIYRSTVYNFCKNLNPSATPEDLLEKLTKLHFDILDEFERECVAEGIPTIASEAYRTWFFETVDIIHRYTANICKPSIDTNAIDRIRTFLFVLQIVLISALNDLQKKPVINGSLNGLKYKELILEDDL